MANIPYTSDSNFRADVLESSTPVLVDFTATWCVPCKALAPKLDQIANDYAGRAKVIKVDVDQSNKLAMSYNVRSVPTLLMFKGGQVVGQELGNVGRDRIMALVEKGL